MILPPAYFRGKFREFWLNTRTNWKKNLFLTKKFHIPARFRVLKCFPKHKSLIKFPIEFFCWMHFFVHFAILCNRTRACKHFLLLLHSNAGKYLLHKTTKIIHMHVVTFISLNSNYSYFFLITEKLRVFVINSNHIKSAIHLFKKKTLKSSLIYYLYWQMWQKNKSVQNNNQFGALSIEN